jgi:penicillin amidase
MKKFGRITFIAIIILIALLIIAVLFIKRISNRSIPDYNQDIQLTGLEQPVNVYRDSLAIPHVFAKNEKDLYTAVGYLMAQDRLWQMDLLRRATTGNLSEIFGKDFVDTDALMRSLRITEKSELVLKNTSPQVLSALEAFANGVNQYIKHNKKDLPVEFAILQYEPELWKPIHSVNLIGYMAWDLTMPWGYEMALHKMKQKLSDEKYASLIPNLSRQKTYVYPEYTEDSIISSMMKNLYSQKVKLENLGLKVFTGSNNWAVSGDKSKTGKPILANDMHLGLFTPGIWSQIHMVAEGKLDVTGVILPGQPFIISGHNNKIAWGMTNVMIDDMDFYKETINPRDSSQYKLNGRWEKMDVSEEIIPIKGGDTAKRKVRFTHRGPIISGFKDIEDQAISMKWIGNEYSNELRTVYLLNHAGNWSEFKDAVSTFISISQNIVYADTDGNIGLYCCAGIPIREGNGIRIYPGDTTQYDWKGLVPFDQLPHTYNPESGFVASANNRTVGDDYPHYISHWFDLPSRINRIRELLKSKEKLSIEDFKKIQTDQKSDMARRIKPIIIEELSSAEDNFNTLEKKGIEMLENWDGSYSKDEASPLIFEELYINLAKNLAKDELGDSLINLFMGKRIMVRNIVDQCLEDSAEWIDDVSTPEKKETLNEIIAESYRKTISDLEEKGGSDPEKWKWGEHHKLTLKHPLSEKKILDRLFKLNKGPYSVGGSYHTVCPYSYSYNNPYEVNHGASHRHIYNLDNLDNSWTVIPTGVSGIPASDHYCDQTELYINKKYHKDIIDKNIIQEQSRYQMKFTKK